MALLFALIGVIAVAYAHANLAHFIAAPSGVHATRAVLIVVGAAFGYVASAYVQHDALRWLMFVAGFGAVHVPPALVLLIKRARHSPKS
ncbi:MAG TPA: hypothetical protein VKZ48_00085 [Burkholderiales bacterium]|nr:hypothetical protein [Burkholderiales bacterium]